MEDRLQGSWKPFSPRVTAVTLSVALALSAAPKIAKATPDDETASATTDADDLNLTWEDAAPQADDAPAAPEADQPVPSDLSAATIAGVKDLSYTGSALTQQLEVTLGDVTLVEGTDYTVSYENNVDKGTATLTITGMGAYEGSASATFAITEATDEAAKDPEQKIDIAAAQVEGLADVVFTSKPQTPVVTVKLGDKTLANGTDYTLSYENNTNAGTATVVITGTGSYTGTARATFNILRASLSSCRIEYIPDCYYTGHAIEPYVWVTQGSNVWLVEGRDYTTSYGENVQVGTGYVTITGTGNYEGSLSASFKIEFAGIEWKRMAGEDRWGTMASVVDEGWKDVTGGTVVIARGDDYKDALSACALAGTDDAPLLLVKDGKLNAQTEAQLKRLKPTKVYIVGGTGAVSRGVAKQIAKATGLKMQGKINATEGIVRVSGLDSASTSAKIAVAGKGKWQDGTAIITTSAGFKDALSVAPVAYAKRWPILLAQEGNSLNVTELKTMKSLGIKRVYLVGGKQAVTEDVEKQLKRAGITVKARLAGNNGVETSRKIADWAVLDLGLSANKMGYATSQNYPDALAGAALCGKNGSVLLLADDKNEATAANVSFATDHEGELREGYIFGGTASFSKELQDKLPLLVTTGTRGLTREQRSAIIDAAYTQLGVPYLLGTSAPGVSFDCSGFSMWCYAKAGIILPHSSVSQCRMSHRIHKEQLQPGDLVFWMGNSGVGAGNHVAIYLGNDKIVHAALGGVTVSNLFYPLTGFGVIE